MDKQEKLIKAVNAELEEWLLSGDVDYLRKAVAVIRAAIEKEVEMIKFISYDGAWPNLCRGTLVVEKDGKQYSMYGVLISGGNVSFDADWEANVEEGDWPIDRNALAPELQDDWRELESLVNDEIPHGCCGGCI